MLAPKWTKLWYEDPNGSAVDELHLKFNQIERLIGEWRKKVFISGRKATNLILKSTNTIRIWALWIFAPSFQFLYVYFFTVMWSNIVVVHSTVFRIAHQLYQFFFFSSSFIPHEIVRWVCRICFFQFAYLVTDSRFCCFLLICFYFMAHVSTDSDSITNFQQFKRVFLFTFVRNAFTRFKAKYTHKHIGKKMSINLMIKKVKQVNICTEHGVR